MCVVCVCVNWFQQCKCDAWTEGSDCSYLNLLPVDKTRMGYIDPVYTSWGGNAVLGSDKQWHLYMAEIACPDTTETRCGLGNWQTNSQVITTSTLSLSFSCSLFRCSLCTYIYSCIMCYTVLR